MKIKGGLFKKRKGMGRRGYMRVIGSKYGQNILHICMKML
jgi:hypothetical protein